jgi:hypothetical protein
MEINLIGTLDLFLTFALVVLEYIACVNDREMVSLLRRLQDFAER